MYWVLKGKDVIKVDDVLVWGKWFERSNRNVGREKLYLKCKKPEHWLKKKSTLSTVFLGIDHGFIPGAPPLLFETMLFHCCLEPMLLDRYPTWDTAEQGHVEWLRKLKTTQLTKLFEKELEG